MKDTKMINSRKAAMVGCGFVGSASVFSLMQSGLFSEIVLIDANKERAEGEAMDIRHGLPFNRPMKIYAGSYEDVRDASIVIITAGAAQKPGETRLDLVSKNVAIFKSIIPRIMQHGFDGILLIVANPVDILTYAAVRLSGLPRERVIGSGTTLDSARLRYELGMHLGLDPRSVHAFIIGEHGDSEIAAWSAANVAGIPIARFCESCGKCTGQENMQSIAEDVKNSAYEIIRRKKATFYGIASSVNHICSTIIRDEHSILPVSTVLSGEYGISDVALSVPTIVGAGGREKIVQLGLSDDELRKLQKSARTLKEILRGIDFTH